MNKAIVFSYVSENVAEHQENIAFVDDVYRKRLKYTFDMDKYIRMGDGEGEPNSGAEMLVILKLQDGVQLDKKLPGKAAVGLGQLSKRATHRYFMSFGDMPDVDWGKQEECEQSS